MDSILEGNKVNKHFGGLMAIMNLDFSLKRGEIHGLIGPNGAGKTTLINCISGFYHADSGAIQFAGIDISGHSSPEICKKGIARTFQIPKYFANETVLRHVMAAAVFGRSSLSGNGAKLRAIEILKFVGLSAKGGLLANELTVSSLKRLGVAMALATEPKLLLLDEPMGGLNPTEIVDAVELVKRIRDEFEITILLVEHIMKVVMHTCDKITVINFGEKICEGIPKDVGGNPEVIKAYLGEKYIV